VRTSATAGDGFEDVAETVGEGVGDGVGLPSELDLNGAMPLVSSQCGRP
jgi:hypothetical protein